MHACSASRETSPELLATAALERRIRQFAASICRRDNNCSSSPPGDFGARPRACPCACRCQTDGKEWLSITLYLAPSAAAGMATRDAPARRLLAWVGKGMFCLIYVLNKPICRVQTIALKETAHQLLVSEASWSAYCSEEIPHSVSVVTSLL